MTRVVILGCGTSSGVPRADGDWGICDPKEPKNRRSRPSIWITNEDTSILIDTSPDLRNQALLNNIKHIDAVLFTHDHADHTHGIDDLRVFAQLSGRPISIYADQITANSLLHRFSYAFGGQDTTLYPPILIHNLIQGPFKLGSMEFIPFYQNHGPIKTLGFRFGPIAYSTDLNSLPTMAFKTLGGVDTWIVDALRETPHPTHTNLETTLTWIAKIKPTRAVLTHMTSELDYNLLKKKLPSGVEPAYDGMVIEV